MPALDPVVAGSPSRCGPEQDVASPGGCEAADDVEGRGLPAPLGADEPADGPRGSSYGQVVDRRDPAEAHGHAAR